MINQIIDKQRGMRGSVPRGLLGGVALSAMALWLGSTATASAFTFTPGDIVIDTVSGLGHPETHREATAERMFLHVLQGHCNSPISGYARVDRSGELSLRACVFTPDGKTRLNAHEWAGRLDPATLGTSVAVALLRQGAREIIDGIPH